MKNRVLSVVIVAMCFIITAASNAMADENKPIERGSGPCSMTPADFPSSDLAGAINFYTEGNKNSLLEVDIPKLSFNFSSGVWSKYVLSSSTISHDKPIFWVDLSMSVGEHFGVEIWESHDFNGEYSDSFADETDVTFSWSDTTKFLYTNINWKAAASYYAISKHNKLDGDMFNFAFDFSAPEVIGKGFSPYVNLDYNEIIGMGGDAWAVETGLKKDFKLDDDFELSTKVGVVWDGGTYGGVEGYNAVASVGLTLPEVWIFSPVLKVEWFGELCGTRSDRDSNNWRVGIDILSIDF